MITPLACPHCGGATEALGQRALLFELGGGLQQKCVSDILTSIRPGQRARLLQCLRDCGALSSLHHSALCLAPSSSSSQHAKAGIFLIASRKSCYISFCSPHLLFPFFFFNLVHFFTSPLYWVPPLFLARRSLFSLPHFLCALQWFFRFFPTIYSLSLFFPSKLASLCFSPSYTYTVRSV